LGGVFDLPQLLKLSGSGTKDEVENFNIPVLIDLPSVGSNLQDNTESGLNTKAPLNFNSTGPPCTFNFTPKDPCLTAWESGVGAGWSYAQRAVPNAIIFKSSVAAFKERNIFLWGSPSRARRLCPLSAESQTPPDPPNTWSYSTVMMHIVGQRGILNLTSSKLV
jgi:choline dehydrogenase